MMARGTLLNMRKTAGALIALLSSVALTASGASLPSCDAGTANYKPCELQFQWNAGEVSAGRSPYRDELVNVEFRGPDQTTYLIHPFWDGGRTLRARFTPDMAGKWTYRVTSDIKRWEVREAAFNVSETTSPGYVSVANLRHWWTANKQPHLWSSVEIPWLRLDDSSYRSFVDARKKDGFTHVRGVLLSQASGGGPIGSDGNPNFVYFNTLDDRLLYAHDQGLVLDLILADSKFVDTGALDQWDAREALIRYVISRYGTLNVSWQGIEHFETRPGNRALLKELATLISKYDVYHHTRSTDAEATSSVLLRDGWENYIIEASPDAQLAAVERQVTGAPQVHVVRSTEPDAFRHELWRSTTNGEYPTISYEAAGNAADLAAMKLWIQVMSGVRHWEFEPFFDVDGASAAGLDNVEYLLYAAKPGTVEIEFPEKHKYDPRWINPATGETIDLKDVKQDTYSVTTPSGSGDWIFQVQRIGEKEGMLRSYKFESMPAPEQEVESDPAKIPFTIAAPAGDEMVATKPVPYQVKITKANRATRSMQYVWLGEVVADGEGPRVFALGGSGEWLFPAGLIKTRPALLNLRVNAINANGKAYSLEKTYQISK